MNQLNDLKRALITVIVHYKDKYRIKNNLLLETKTEATYEKELDLDSDPFEIIFDETESTLMLEQEALHNKLLQLIQDATKDNPTRLPLLNYLMQIILLLNQTTTHGSMDDARLNGVMVDFLTHIKELYYSVNRDQSLTVSIGGEPVKIEKLPSSGSKLALNIYQYILMPLQIFRDTDQTVLTETVTRLISNSLAKPVVPEKQTNDIDLDYHTDQLTLHDVSAESKILAVTEEPHTVTAQSDAEKSLPLIEHSNTKEPLLIAQSDTLPKATSPLAQHSMFNLQRQTRHEVSPDVHPTPNSLQMHMHPMMQPSLFGLISHYVARKIEEVTTELSKGFDSGEEDNNATLFLQSLG
jgi:hypothetical protein